MGAHAVFYLGVLPSFGPIKCKIHAYALLPLHTPLPPGEGNAPTSTHMPRARPAPSLRREAANLARDMCVEGNGKPRREWECVDGNVWMGMCGREWETPGEGNGNVWMGNPGFGFMLTDMCVEAWKVGRGRLGLEEPLTLTVKNVTLAFNVSI